MDFETMQKIVDGAPEWADTYLFHGIYSDSKIVDCGSVGISLSDLRDQLAKREPMDLRDVDIPHGTIVLEK